MKTCKKCGNTFEGSCCKPCDRIRCAEYRANNPEKSKASTAKWRKNNLQKLKSIGQKYRIENREKTIASTRKWQIANPEKVNATAERWRKNNPDKVKVSFEKWKDRNPGKMAVAYANYRANNLEKCRANYVKWISSHPEMIRIYRQNRRAKKLSNGGKLSKGLAEKLFTLQRGKCACCGLPLGDNYHLDHRMPLALGGANEDSNMQLLRQRCNNQKGAKHPIDFMQSRGFLL